MNAAVDLPEWLESGARNPEELATDTKTRIAGKIRAADPDTEISFTSYFNHTYLPDMVLRWRREPGTRLLYVRTTDRTDWLADDMDVVAKDKPVIFAIGPQLESDPGSSLHEAGLGDLNAAAVEQGTSLMSPWGLSEFATQAGAGGVQRLVSHLALSGGRGIANKSSAAELESDAAAAFAGAFDADAEATTQGASDFRSQLNPTQAEQAIRMLHAFWVGFGASDASFPTERSLGVLSASEIELLMQTLGDGPPGFWRNVALASTLDEIELLDVPGYSKSFNELIAANVGRISARALRVLHEPRTTDEPPQSPYWYVRNQRLAIRAENWTAYVGRNKAALPGDGEALSAPVSLTELRMRANRTDVSLSSVNSVDGDLDVALRSRSRGQLLANQRVAEHLSSDQTTLIETVIADLPVSGALSVDFSAATAVGVGQSRFDLATLCRSSLGLLLRSSGDQWDEVVKLLPYDASDPASVGPPLPFDEYEAGDLAYGSDEL